MAVRVRPPHPHEVSDPGWRDCVHLGADGRSLSITEGDAGVGDAVPGFHSGQVFSFDAVFSGDCRQEEVYAATAREAVQSVLQGYNATVLAYGQTGTGKTHTMEGYDDEELRGLIPRAVSDLFHLIRSSSSPSSHFLVRASYIQIYNDTITDLLIAPSSSPSSPSPTPLLIREDKVRGVFIGGLSEWVVRNTSEVMSLLKRGSAQRATGATKSNETSSRSHAVFMLTLEQTRRGDPSPAAATAPVFLTARLNLVDLAGSERIRLSGASGVRLGETKAINQSLSALANVISALIKHRQHVPYRDSKLTRLLQSSIGGNTRTTLLAMLSPSPAHWAENVSTLAFASRARKVENRVELNEGVDERSLLRKYERELTRLRAEVAERGENVVDVRRLMRVAEEKRRVEEDKAAALERVKALSESLQREKALKRTLEAKIEEMNGRMLVGGGGDARAMELKVKELERRWEEAEAARAQLSEVAEKSEAYELLVQQQRDVIRRMTQSIDGHEVEHRRLTEDRDAWRAKCRDVERVYDALETRLLRLQQGGGDDEGDAAEEVEESQGTRLAVIVTPWGDEGGAAEEGEEVTAVTVRPPVRSPAGVAAEAARVAEVRGAREREERDALIVILDQKMQAMVERIDGCIAGGPMGASGGDGRMEDARREVAALKRLIAASVLALRHSQAQQAGTPMSESEEAQEGDERASGQDTNIPVRSGDAARSIRGGGGKRAEYEEEKEAEHDEEQEAEHLPPSVFSARTAASASSAAFPLAQSSSAQRAAASLEALQQSMRKNREELARFQQRLQR